MKKQHSIVTHDGEMCLISSSTFSLCKGKAEKIIITLIISFSPNRRTFRFKTIPASEFMVRIRNQKKRQRINDENYTKKSWNFPHTTFFIFSLAAERKINKLENLLFAVFLLLRFTFTFKGDSLWGVCIIL